MAVFVTGGTGFLGRQLVAGLRARGEAVLLLVRGRDRAEAEAKARDTLGTGPHGLPPVCLGSLGAPGLGLSPADRERVLAECDGFLHCGATVRFDLPLEAARRVNVEGTRELLALARERSRRGGVARFDHVSTAYVAGRRTDVVGEGELDDRAGHKNSYERSKFESEGLVREAARELPVTVYRPSIVAGESREGRTSSFKMIYWPLRVYVSGLWRICPGHPGTPLDIVPVDFVRDALLEIRSRPGSLGRTFHLAAGPEGSLTLGQAASLAGAVFGGAKPVRFVDPGPWMRWVHPLLKHLTFGAPRRVVRAGEAYVPYFVSNPRFDNAGTREMLADSPLRVPRVDEYLERLFRFCLETDFGRAERRNEGTN